MRLPRRPAPGARSGFTLAEAAITIAIVGIGLAFSVQALNGAAQTAAHTQRMKIARELGVEHLGEIAAGLWWDELESTRYGTFADKERPEYTWELALGDEQLEAVRTGDEAAWEGQRFDNWQYRRDQEAINSGYSSAEDMDAEEETVEEYEQLRLRVSFPFLPGLEDLDHHIELERWIPWEQVYGPSEDEEGADGLEDADLPGSSGGSAGGAGGASAGGSASSATTATKGGGR
jgi:hypothetical protein